MNITPINAVSFRGEWRKRKVCTKKDSIGMIGRDYFSIIHTYRPYADETPSEIAKAIAEKQAEFAKAKPRYDGIGPDLTHVYRKVVNEKLGKTLLSPKATTKLKAKQAKLQGLQAEAKRLLGVINAELVKVGKKLAQRPEALKRAEARAKVKKVVAKPVAKPKKHRVKDVVYRTAHGLATTFQPKPMRIVKKGNITHII